MVESIAESLDELSEHLATAGWPDTTSRADRATVHAALRDTLGHEPASVLVDWFVFTSSRPGQPTTQGMNALDLAFALQAQGNIDETAVPIENWDFPDKFIVAGPNGEPDFFPIGGNDSGSLFVVSPASATDQEPKILGFEFGEEFFWIAENGARTSRTVRDRADLPTLATWVDRLVEVFARGGLLRHDQQGFTAPFDTTDRGGWDTYPWPTPDRVPPAPAIDSSFTIEAPAAQTAVSPDRTHIGVLRRDARAIQIWDAANGEPAQSLEVSPPRHPHVFWSPDSSLFCVQGGGVTAMFSLAAGEVTHSVEGRFTQFSPDNTRLSVVHDDHIDIADAQTGATLQRLQTTALVSAWWSPDSSMVLLSGMTKGSGSAVWDIDGGEIIHRSRHNSGSWSNDGKLLFGARRERSATIWDSSSHTETTLHADTKFTSLAFSPDGSRIASATRGETPRIWDGQSDRPLLILDGEEVPALRGMQLRSQIAWSPHGALLASNAGSDGEIRIWDATTGDIVHTLEAVSNHIPENPWSPDGDRFLTGWNQTLVWDVATGTVSHVLSPGRQSRPTHVWVSNDSIITHEHAIHRWDLA